jgi:hypothetical protein
MHHPFIVGEFMGAGLLWLRFGHGKQKLHGV